MITVILIVHIRIAVKTNATMDMTTITGMTIGIIIGRNHNKSRVFKGWMVMDMSKVKTKEVWSANNWYLFWGMVFICLIIALEGCAVRELFIAPINEAIGVAIILQLPCFLCLWFTTLIRDWKYRKKFTLYYCKLETGVDIDHIKKNYLVVDINSNGVLFVKKEDSYNFSSGKLLQGYNSLYEAEVKLFSQ